MKRNRDDIVLEPGRVVRPKEPHKLPTAERVRAARRTPQAVLKITGHARGRGGVRRHWDYITRKGTLAAETESGELVTGREAQQDLLKAWAMDFGGRKGGRDQVNIVLSVPPGADPKALREAVREFAAVQFGEAGHKYIFVQHEDTKHPHIHLAVKAQGRDRKLHMPKGIVQEWRALFAEKCRAHGIEVGASPRRTRGVGRKGTKQEILAMRRRGVVPKNDRAAAKAAADEVRAGAPSPAPWEKAILERDRIEREAYRAEAARVRLSADAQQPGKVRDELQRAAADLEAFAKTMPTPQTRHQAFKAEIRRQRQKDRGRGPER